MNEANLSIHMRRNVSMKVEGTYALRVGQRVLHRDNSIPIWWLRCKTGFKTPSEIGIPLPWFCLRQRSWRFWHALGSSGSNGFCKTLILFSSNLFIIYWISLSISTVTLLHTDISHSLWQYWSKVAGKTIVPKDSSWYISCSRHLVRFTKGPLC